MYNLLKMTTDVSYLVQSHVRQLISQVTRGAVYAGARRRFVTIDGQELL